MGPIEVINLSRDKKQARSRSGKVTETTYLSIAHNVVEDSPEGKRSKPVVFANLGMLGTAGFLRDHLR